MYKFYNLIYNKSLKFEVFTGQMATLIVLRS